HDALLKMPSRHPFHRDEESIKRAAGGEHPHHVRMAERGGDPRLLLESRNPSLVRRIIFVEDLQRHLAAERVVPGQEHHAHPANRVALVERVGTKLALYPRVLTAGRALDIRKWGHRSYVHRAATSVAVGNDR